VVEREREGGGEREREMIRLRAAVTPVMQKNETFVHHFPSKWSNSFFFFFFSPPFLIAQ